jgi:hypothetical protein
MFSYGLRERGSILGRFKAFTAEFKLELSAMDIWIKLYLTGNTLRLRYRGQPVNIM